MRFPTFLQRSGTSPGRVRRNLAHTFGIGALVALLMASGVGVTFALWNSQAEARSSIGGAKLELTTTFADLDFTFANNSLRTTGTFTVTNVTETNSTLPGAVAAQLSAPGDAGLASNLDVAVWRDSVAACTVANAPPSATLGKWNSIAPATVALAPGNSATFCVRVTGVERGVMGDADGSMTITPTVSAKLTMGNWNSVAVTSSATQTTNAIYPATAPSVGVWQQIVNRQTLDCVDVHGSTATSGTGAIDYPCKWGTDTGTHNQQWQFSVAASVSGGTYYAMTPRHSTGLRMGIDGSSVNTLAEAKVLTNSTTAHSQQWQPQYRAAGVFQLVNRNSGLCLTPHNTATYGDLEYVQAVCDSTRTDQTFSVRTPFNVPTMAPLGCNPATGGALNLTWTGSIPANVDFSIAPDPQGGASSTVLGSVAYSANTFPISASQFGGSDGKYLVSVAGGGNSLASAAVWRTTTSGVTTLSCTQPVPPLNSLSCTASPPNSVVIGWGHAAPSAYTIELFSNGGWIYEGTANAGASSYTVLGGQNWYSGVRQLRVVSGSESVEISVYNSRQGDSLLWCLPAPTIAASCNAQSNGDYITLSWPRLSSDTNTRIRVSGAGFSTFTRDVTTSGNNSSVTIRDDEVRYFNAGSHSVTIALESNTQAVASLDRSFRVSGTGTGTNSKNIYCD